MNIERITQTPFISHDDKNMFYISVKDWDLCNPYGVQIWIKGQAVYQQSVFAPVFSVLLPCYEHDVDCVVRITPFEDLPVEKVFTIHPPKHWQIPLLYSSHEDLGYCAYIDKLHYECYEYLKSAMMLCRKHDGFRYMIEHVWWLEAFDSYACEEEKEELKRLLKEKRIELIVSHSGVHTVWSNSEQLVRQLYFGCRDAVQKYDIAPTCELYADISGIAWSAVSAHAQMGIKYMAVLPNGFRNCAEKKEFPPLFWWEDKSGQERVLFWYLRAYRADGLWGIWCDTKRQYPQGEFGFDATKAVNTEKWLTERVERLGEVEYDILPFSFYDDREYPTDMLLTVCEEMNKRWKYPRFYMEVPSVFLGEIEEKYGDSLPVIRGEIPDQWADFNTIAPQLTAKRRELSRVFYDAEMLSVIETMQGRCRDAEIAGEGSVTADENSTGHDRGFTMHQGNLFARAVWNMGEFDEHCWATSSKHPQNMHRYNINRVKKETVLQSSLDMELLRDNAIGKSTVSGKSDTEKLSVISTIAQGRCDHLRVNSSEPVPEGVKHQILPDATVVTSPIECQGVSRQNHRAVLPFRESVEIEGDSFVTPYYKVSFSRESQKILSIIDLETEQELLDTNSRYELGQFIYLYSEGKMQLASGIEVPKKRFFQVYEGDAAFVIVQEGYEEQSGADVRAQFLFYKEEKNIDMDLSYKNAAGLIGDFYDRYKKNYFFALPFQVENPVFYTENAVGEFREDTEKLSINAADFSVTANWLAAGNEKGGVAVFTRDMPTFHIGRLKYNHFETSFSENKAHYYLYAGSNRCNNLIYTAIEECHAEYHLSVLPFTGSHSGIVPEWSDRKEHSLLLGKALEADEQYLYMEQKNVRLVAFKKAEDCDNAVILRFIETQGKKTTGKMHLFFAPQRAVYTDNREMDTGEEAMTDGNMVCFNIAPWSYATLKVYLPCRKGEEICC